MTAEVFSGLPNELKTIEIDVEKRKFLVNGEPFGHSRGFNLEIVCKASEGYEVSLKVNTDVKFKSYTMKGEEKDLPEEQDGKANLIEEIDDVIRVICKKIQDYDVAPGIYPEVIKSLAALVKSRSELDANNRAFYSGQAGKNPIISLGENEKKEIYDTIRRNQALFRQS